MVSGSRAVFRMMKNGYISMVKLRKKFLLTILPLTVRMWILVLGYMRIMKDIIKLVAATQ